ncbi:complex I 51 kDa subunit family protein [Parasporobacterium paucivorans]|uniref:NADH-quinone oxidoreductase subunit F n=1 Tax=Parasporobacterium paucivorans DSM 15970 TaxID=1122934 RepID=A0A1M6J3Q9_9FIRM|nr:NADH-ubiquinone oxidoreductase-F iron-sulfur binding region domain-containing protein [Parasporobacterium paucivorans]SHJ41319.1 NADH-quinone oxidoreductase subunit F [Parasporobacterium paucivorans DSM 15970]
MEETRVLLRNKDVANMVDVAVSMEHGGYVGLRNALLMDGAQVIETLRDSGLRGRGGAGFPTWMKIKFAYDAGGTSKVVVCNADEGEPGTSKDRILLSTDPHSIFEGMAIVGKAIGAGRGFIYLRAEYSYLFPILENALDSARKSGILGKNILGSDFSFDIEMRSGAGAYVCGEETALFESIEGKRGEPRTRPPYPGTYGLFGLPTVLNNVETLANIGPIFANGVDWFRSIGSENSPGTKLFTVTGNVHRRGVFEFPMGTNLKDIIYEVCGGIAGGKELLAVQTGGASGAIIRPSQIDIPLDIDHVASSGGRLGCGTIFVIDDSNCVLDIVKNTLEFFTNESCGKCIPCREGGVQLLKLIKKISEGRGSVIDIDTMMDLSNTMRETALCGLGHSTPVPVLTSIANFRDSYDRHLDKDPCSKCSPERGLK